MITSRPDKDEYFLTMAHVVSLRATCRRRRVGCVLVNSLGHVIATGYNGPPRGMRHCIDHPCAGAGAPPGQGLELCQAIHAEQNALIQCFDTNMIHTCYTTDSPCMHCVKMLMNTSCQRVVFSRDYAHSEAESLWLQSETVWGPRKWIKHHETINAKVANPSKAMRQIAESYGVE